MATTTFSLLALASSIFGSFSGAAPVAERIDGYHIRAEVEADRMQFENCMERLNNGETSLQHCVPQWAPPIVVEATTTTTTTTTTAPPVTTPPTTTVPPAPTTTVPPTTTTTTVPPTTTAPPADPVEACIADQSVCLTDAALSWMDDNWPLMVEGVTPPPYIQFTPGLWDGLCKLTECEYLNGERKYTWRLAETLSFDDFASFADVWCPGVAGGEGTSAYGAACNTGHVSGGNFEVNYYGGFLRGATTEGLSRLRSGALNSNGSKPKDCRRRNEPKGAPAATYSTS